MSSPEWYADAQLEPHRLKPHPTTVSQRCLTELLQRDHCNSNNSCQLGARASHDPSSAQLSSTEAVDTAAYRDGYRMHQACRDGAIDQHLG